MSKSTEADRAIPGNSVVCQSVQGDRVVNRVDHLHELPLHMAKAKLGACVREAIGPRALKEFGDKGLMGNVISGEKAPEYMARIYQDPAARRRLALALLKDDPAVKVRTVIEVDEEVA